MDHMLTLSFAQRPVLRPDLYSVEPGSDLYKSGLPVLSGTMLQSMDRGLMDLALKIFEINERRSWNKSPSNSMDRPTGLGKILNIIFSMSPTVLRAAITCSLHNLWGDPDARLPRNHQVNLVGRDQDAERPVIYALVHCSPTGQAATKIQILDCISEMEQYIGRWYEGSLEWESADTLAFEIDHFKYKSWASGTSGKCNWKKGLHPRRFASTSGAREQIGEFCRSIRARLNHVPDDEESRTRPLPWTVVYVGYTGKEAKRAYQHERHETGGPVIPYLFETIMMMKFRDCQYLLRNMSIMNITRLSDVRCAEHIVSILASSYSEHGGLNGTLGGPVALETRAGSISKQGWQNATRALVNQGVFEANDSLVKEQLARRRFFEKYEEEGSELRTWKKKNEEVTKTKGELREILEVEQHNVANIAYLRTKELETDIQITRNVGRLASLMNINDRLVKLRERVASNVPPLSMDRSDIESQADDGLVSSSPIPTTQMTRLSTNDDRTLK
ncbi:uncharacterized protein EAE98_010246 [Botrytis deweyae]|uniref:Uncharacterized protein n=1 Tax=Botrytis deweyae TaxID=2478750 RepID=A0ABQ7IA89_9HELO|nr:uncharacterized protein EAE98_010246 [Botrytis deweyae]KAF7917483.1 hypothetical protein EAE98_010246 [Botrytis deweyae]